MSAPRTLKPEILSSKTRRLNRIVIAGAGPMGLFVAIRLRQLGLKNIVVVDKHAGTYNRSGDFHFEVFSAISTLLKIEIEPSAGKHIKDLERALFQHAVKLKIKFIHKNFSGFSKSTKKIILGDEEEKSQSEHRCDVLFDCTGTKRAVITACNKLTPDQPAFQSKRIAGNPQRSFIFARGKMNTLETMRVNRCEPLGLSADYLTTRLQELQNLGWHDKTIPYFYINSTHKKKINFYSQAPDALPPEEQLAYVKSVLKLGVGCDQTSFELRHESKTHPKKARLSHFDVDPHYTTPAYTAKNKKRPLVFHAGDATLNMPFYETESLVQGACRIEKLFQSIRVIKGRIAEIDLTRYATGLRDIVAKNLKQIRKGFRYHTKRFASHRALLKHIVNPDLKPITTHITRDVTFHYPSNVATIFNQKKTPDVSEEKTKKADAVRWHRLQPRR